MKLCTEKKSVHLGGRGWGVITGWRCFLRCQLNGNDNGGGRYIKQVFLTVNNFQRGSGHLASPLIWFIIGSSNQRLWEEPLHEKSPSSPEDEVCLTTILPEIKALTNACKLQPGINQHEVCLSSLAQAVPFPFLMDCSAVAG